MEMQENLQSWHHSLSLNPGLAFRLFDLICLFLSFQLLCTVVVSARVLTTPNPAEQSILSPRKYQHTDPDSGTQLVCDKCPAGTFVSAHCSPSTVRECSPCPEGTFTRGENGVQQCHRCRAPCPAGLLEKASCTPTQDRICSCPPNSFLTEAGGLQCKPHSLCPPGTRVKKRGTEKEDVLCKPCNKGTFSDVESSAVKCQTHQDCESQGLVLLIPGTKETDNVCGPLSPTSTTPSLSTTALGLPQAQLLQKLVNSPSAPSSELSEHDQKGEPRR